MKFLSIITAFLGLGSGTQIAAAEPTIPSFFVFAKLPDKIMPVERESKYEDPLNAVLQKAHLGEVTGGGTMQNKDKTIKWVGVDIQLINLDKALEFTKTKLREFGAPHGSTLEYKSGDKNIVEFLYDSDNTAEQGAAANP